MSKLFSIVIGAAILGASSAAVAQTTGTTGGTMKPGDTMSSSSSMQNSIDFKIMDKNADGMVSRDEYVGYYGGRFDRMKRNEKGMVMMEDMQMWDGARAPTAGGTSNITNNPTTDRAGTKGGSGNPPATGGGSK